mgnify:CR=1 FL=1|tara:strand:- start:1128 stop:1787 length:660 start_codon:yes stop_codon:yes gene_type:complete
MNIDYSKLENLKILDKNIKQKIIKINGLIKNNKKNVILNSLKKSYKNPTKIFKYKKKIIKYEFNDFTKFDNDFKNLYKELNSKKFIDFLKKIFSTQELFSDKKNLYSGINISVKDSILKEHVDFNYNNDLKKFRSINLLLYLNVNYKIEDGGRFYYRNIKSNRRYYIDPSFNKAVIFMTNKNVPHGFTKVNKKRISLNLYYYTNKNYSLTKYKHATHWK